MFRLRTPFGIPTGQVHYNYPISSANIKRNPKSVFRHNLVS